MDYQKFLNESLIEFVRKVLMKVQYEGLIGNHHFYISFITDDPGVKLSGKIKRHYPNEITIVLQNQFEDLIVNRDSFSVRLSFDGISEVVEVPFRCLTSFADPSVNFTLQFNNHFSHNEQVSLTSVKKNKIPEINEKSELTKVENSNNVIILDKFRNKNKPK